MNKFIVHGAPLTPIEIASATLLRPQQMWVAGTPSTGASHSCPMPAQIRRRMWSVRFILTSRDVTRIYGPVLELINSVAATVGQGRPWPAIADQPRPAMACHGRPLPALAGPGRPRPAKAGHGRPWPATAGQGWPWPRLALAVHGQTRPSLVGQGRPGPSLAGPGRP